jgi:hypothetical protein
VDTPSEPAPSGAGFSASTRAGIARGGAAALTVLERAIPVARRLVGIMNAYSWTVIAASVILAVIVAVVTRPVTVGSVVPYLLFLVLLAVPCVTLRLFHGALVEVLAMPDWLRMSPDFVRNHGTELAQIAGQAAVHSRDRLLSVPGDIFRSGRLLMKAHGDLPEYGRLVRLVNLPFLFVVLVSFLAGFPIIGFTVLLAVLTPILYLVT